MKRSKKLEIRGNVYDIDYPNTGQQIDIELLKAKISDGNYDILRFSTNPMFQAQADKIDMIATFGVLIPQLKKDINVSSLFFLEEEASNELLSVYEEQFGPWYAGIKKSIQDPKKELDQKEEPKDLIEDKYEDK